jgi:hypothetical protein
VGARSLLIHPSLEFGVGVVRIETESDVPHIEDAAGAQHCCRVEQSLLLPGIWQLMQG